MYVGPRGASGFVSGSVACQASNATLNSGRNRRSASAIFDGLSNVKAVNQALNVLESKLRISMASDSARFASNRSVDAWASCTRDSVLHFAAENPAHAVT